MPGGRGQTSPPGCPGVDDSAWRCLVTASLLRVEHPIPRILSNISYEASPDGPDPDIHRAVSMPTASLKTSHAPPNSSWRTPGALTLTVPADLRADNCVGKRCP